MTIWICNHCNRDIIDSHSMWSRKGIHWCSKGCYDQDKSCDWFKNLKRKKNNRMLLGNNKLILNEATMKTIVQEWLERKIINFDSGIEYVTYDKGLFTIGLSEKLKVDSK